MLNNLRLPIHDVVTQVSSQHVGRVNSYGRAPGGAMSFLPGQAPSHISHRGEAGRDRATTMHQHRPWVAESVRREAGHSTGTTQPRHGPWCWPWPWPQPEPRCNCGDSKQGRAVEAPLGEEYIASFIISFFSVLLSKVILDRLSSCQKRTAD